MERVTYREIIKRNLREVVERKEREKERVEYWDRVIANLIADLREYEGRGRWPREPKDRLWERFNWSRDFSFKEIDELFRRLFEEFFRDF